MKLMTEMQAWRDGKTIPVAPDASKSFFMMEHDAAAAHALMQAMDWVSSNGIGCDPYEVPDFIRDRADEIMREWGYA